MAIMLTGVSVPQSAPKGTLVADASDPGGDLKTEANSRFPAIPLACDKTCSRGFKRAL